MAPESPLDVREPPFADGDFSWFNGSNRQPESLLKIGPATLSIIVDAYYLWSFARPIDHTAFPSTTAPRHNEISLNMAGVGLEIPPNAIDSKKGGPVGQFSLQYGSMGETNFGQDRSLSRGFYLTKAAFLPIRTASAGWHFHWLHGVNTEIGIFPSYVALESYLPQENWNYLHPFVSDFTPYYFSGSRTQIYTGRSSKLELWNRQRLANVWTVAGGPGRRLFVELETDGAILGDEHRVCGPGNALRFEIVALVHGQLCAAPILQESRRVHSQRRGLSRGRSGLRIPW